MDVFSVLNLIGGLALFLFGMHIMGIGLEKVSGGKLESTLEKMTNSTIKGLLLGAGVTAVIQSSSATTVMVVGFVNSGIMKLSQAIGIIMGANVGTTATAWILSLTGIEGDSILVKMFKPTSFSPIIAIIGVILIVFCKKSKQHNIGSICIGFSLIMTGMSTMSSAVEPLADIPEFTNILTMFNNPVLGILTGALLTAIIQSSSASVGILQALSSTGGITYGMAIPIVMGQNIGTCVTALISCIGANKNAKRAAMVHLYFNIIGSAAWCVLFYGVNSLVNFSFINDTVGPAEIAVIHTIFNIFSTLLLFPFAKQLEKLAYFTIKDTDEHNDEIFIDERFLDTPGLATERCRDMANKMAEVTKTGFTEAISLLNNYRDSVARSVKEKEKLVDKYEDVLGSYLVKLSAKDLTGKESREVSELLLCISDWERISDHSVNVMKSAREMHNKKIKFSPTAKNEIKVMGEALTEIVKNTTDCFVNNDSNLAAKIEPLEQIVDNLKSEVRNRHIKRLKDGVCTVELGFIHFDLITSFERVSDHCSNIAVCIIQINRKSFETHEYLNEIKTSDYNYKQNYNLYKEKYVLPIISDAKADV